MFAVVSIFTCTEHTSKKPYLFLDTD